MSVLATVLAGPLLLLGPAATGAVPQPPITLDAEQSTVLCEERIPAWLTRIDLLQDRIDGSVTVLGSTAWLQQRVERAEASGPALAADRLRDRLDRRPLLIERLAEVEAEIVAVRDTQCVS